jgi:hypothetical protein
MKIKPLVAAISAALPVAALAATITPATSNTVTNEYLDVKGGVAAAAATIALGAQYAVGDILTISYSATPRATLSGTAGYSWPTTLGISVVSTAAFGASSTTASSDATTGIMSLFDSADNSVSYRVTRAPVSPVGDFGTVNQPANIFFNAAEIGTSDVTISTAAATAQGTSFDAGTAKKVVDNEGNQFAYTIGGLSATIDVESARKAWIASGSTASTVAFTITVNTDAQTSTNLATAGSIAVSITGSDFSFVDSSSTATGIQTGGLSLTNASLVGISSSSIALSIASNVTSASITLQNFGSTAALRSILTNQNLTGTLSGYYDDGGTEVGVNTFSQTGAFSLNGSTVTVYAVPTSPAVSNFIWLSNTGTTEGEVSIIVYDGEDTIDLGVVGTSEGGTNFDVTAALDDALATAGETLSGGRVHMDIITKVPAADVAISAAYRVGDDRVNLLTSLETNL